MDAMNQSELLLDILNVMKLKGISANEMAIIIQSYIAEFGFLDDQTANEVRIILGIRE